MQAVNPGTRKWRWLKWTLIGMGALLFPIVATIAWLILSPRKPSRIEAVSEHWVIEHYDKGNVDGLNVTHLARRGARGNTGVSGNLLDFRYVGDDCVIYSDWATSLYGVCGEGAPVFVELASRAQAPSLESDTITTNGRQFSVAEIKRAAQHVSEERPGGHWRAQRQAFPYPSDPQGMPRFILFHEDSARLVEPVRRVYGWVVAYRYLGQDCLLYVRPTVDSGEYAIVAACGERYEIDLGLVRQPSDALANPPIVLGQSMSVSEMRRRALAEKER